MTGRGKQGMRPATPPDPTLKSRPVPRSRHFAVLPFGPASASDIHNTAPSLEDIDEAIGIDEVKRQNLGGKTHVRSLLEDLYILSLPSSDDEEWEPDPTWGFYVFVTSYSDSALEYLPKAMDNWIKLAQRDLMHYGPYGAEAFRRLRMDVIADEEALSGASDDRIREELNAQIHGLESSGQGQSTLARRHRGCFVLGEDLIVKLAGLTFPNDSRQDHGSFSNITVKFIDRFWKWRPLGTPFTYKGIRSCSITSLAEIFELLASNSLSLEEIHGLRPPFAP
ncbi:hypothetical protein P170DRAFT_438254 [Aspergillus steynii IBT 23096]|uniref:Uncharacterized protein n=1 Tax=Aspergillus steynii IBT 23096 TaxID=1392250 RepID=A0A2I2G0S4_9EURO|nr:uncharacterized protein P170DRAFT_438254 [Aspergillus steynii IBT 23096]PLB46473.1 hypothetical protein P170DRAFT_438254 [Aspergillus steynii IBT 23096]